MAKTSSWLNGVTRGTGAINIVLGLMFWTGNALNLVPFHMLAGLILVAALWTLAILALIAGVVRPLAFVGLGWGAAAIVLGLTQNAPPLLGNVHAMVQAFHFLLGLGAIGQSEGLGRALRSNVRATSRTVPA
jgi:hypothetical protein